MLGFYEPLERRLCAMPSSFTEAVQLPIRLKSAALVADLAALDGTTAITPTCAVVPEVTSVDRAFGVMYVLEGATLGAKVIARHVAPYIDIASCSAFLGIYGEETGKMWRTFCEALETHGRWPGCDTRAVVAAGEDTFRMLEVWLGRVREAA